MKRKHSDSYSNIKIYKCNVILHTKNTDHRFHIGWSVFLFWVEYITNLSLDITTRKNMSPTIGQPVYIAS